MISVKRTNAPKYLTRYAQKWTDELLTAIEQYQKGGEKPSNTLWNKYNKPYIRDVLKQMFHDKCAYCESKISYVTYPHIEHYRPKSKYPHYTFEWQNLLWACGMCNSPTYKGDNFPLEDGDEDRPLLLNPCIDDPTQHLQFKEARIVPLSERGRQTCGLLGLNRDELYDQRKDLLYKIAFIRKAVEDYKQVGNDIMVHEGEVLLNLATFAEAKYTAMVRQFMADPLPEQPPI